MQALITPQKYSPILRGTTRFNTPAATIFHGQYLAPPWIRIAAQAVIGINAAVPAPLACLTYRLRCIAAPAGAVNRTADLDAYWCTRAVIPVILVPILARMLRAIATILLISVLMLVLVSRPRCHASRKRRDEEQQAENWQGFHRFFLEM